jgi:phosphohistidine phosphatase
MFLCLMRHGKAEPFVEGSDDSLRKLNEQGRQQVEAMAQLAKGWWPAGTTRIWASPYDRACETAEIMSRQIHVSDMKCHGAIADGDLDMFYEYVLQDEAADIVLVIGHEPFLGRWMAKLTGTPLDFKAGSMALLEYDPTAGQYGQGTLLFYVQPKATILLL